jgi:threonine dehydratase
MIPHIWFIEAQNRIRPYIKITPITRDENLDVAIKWENHQVTGSFKARGALNKVLSLNARERSQGLVAASAGNHGQGVALAASIVQTRSVVFLPRSASAIKVEAIRKAGARMEFVEGGYELAERTAREYAVKNSMIWISPYNDGQVICGQGTIALELMDQIDIAKYKSIVVPIGGGGLIAGIGLVIKEIFPDIKIIGVQSTASSYFHGLYYRNTQEDVVELPGLADGLEGRVEDDSVTIPIVRQVVDEIALVSEAEIREAIRWSWKNYNEVIEGSAAVTLAARLNGKIKPLPAVLIISGGNIVGDLHRKIMEEAG